MRKSFINLLAGIALAILAVFLVSSYGSKKDQKSSNGTVKIVIAARDMPFGSNVLRDYLQYAEWPSSSAPVGAFTDMAALTDDKEGKGSRVVLRALRRGDPLVKSQISGFGDKSTLSRKVSEDKRAFSVRVNDVSGVAGFLLPGDRVDIMLTQGGANLSTEVILQNLMILGIDQLTDEGSEKPTLARTVTMEVTADQAQKLALAQQVGTLSLTLRNYTNNAQVPTGRVSVSDLKGMSRDNLTDSSISAGVVRIRRGLNID